MKISTITVCYNSAATIRHTVESFLEQDYPDREMVVVDGASKDDTLDIVRSYGSDLIRIHSERDRGIYDAMSKGLRLFQGDAAGFLNSDDRYHDRFALSAIADGLSRFDMVQGDLRFVDSHETRNTVRTWRASPKPPAGFRTGWMPAHPTFYVRRAVVDFAGGFDLSMKLASDYDWMLRAIEMGGFSIGEVAGLLVDMLPGGASNSDVKAYVQGNLESLRSRRAWLKAGPVDYALFAKPLRKVGQFLDRGAV